MYLNFQQISGFLQLFFFVDNKHPKTNGKTRDILIGVVVILGLAVLAALYIAGREWMKRRRAETNADLERIKLTGSTYSDVKKRYLK